MPNTDDLHPQDWLLIIKGLEIFADDLTFCGREPPRAERARYLADRFAAEQGIHRDAMHTQIDTSWNGPGEYTRP